MCVPKGVPDARLAVVLDMMASLLRPEMQAYSYDEGYLYPGPAVRGVPDSAIAATSVGERLGDGRADLRALLIVATACLEQRRADTE